ncbi:MAG TPA: DUF2254 domain-containing protein, partial [Hyphomicrobiaceae bacterium]|nr:DUF2254 domain-containing protein [Hyphomicrobiaceae bacterium]
MVRSRVWFFLRKLRERLWLKPLVYCLAAVAAAFLAHTADYVGVGWLAPVVTPETIEQLLSIISTSMLTVATLAVASMVSAYASAASTATPRAFALVIADDVSQVALSSFIGAFIFSIVGFIAVKTGYYGPAGRFALFLMTVVIFAWVIITFVRWVDNIARLGRIGPTVTKVEAATLDAMRLLRSAPALGGKPLVAGTPRGEPVFCASVGYVQHIDMQALQDAAEEMRAEIAVACLPGSFIGPGHPIAYVMHGTSELDERARSWMADAFLIEPERTFEEDPRFGLIVLSEIAARALSPAVNDPGTAIAILGSFIRLLAFWVEPADDGVNTEVHYDRLHVPSLSLNDMFDDAFTAIARDGAATVEVGIRLQKAFRSLAA